MAGYIYVDLAWVSSPLLTLVPASMGSQPMRWYTTLTPNGSSPLNQSNHLWKCLQRQQLEVCFTKLLEISLHSKSDNQQYYHSSHERV